MHRGVPHQTPPTTMVIRMSPTAATDPTSTGWAPRTLAPVSRLGKEKPLMEMLINGRTILIRHAIFHNHDTGKPVFFLYKLKSVVYNALLSAGKLPLMVDYRALHWSGNPYGNGYGLEMDGNGAQFVKRLWIGLDLRKAISLKRYNRYGTFIKHDIGKQHRSKVISQEYSSD